MDAPAVVPEAESNRSQSPVGLKRRQPDANEREDDGKRQRLEPDEEDRLSHDGVDEPESRTDSLTTESKPVGDTASNTRQPRRRGMGVDEKQRGKRLFGALLGSLNQPSDRVAKRRQEIESRRKTELQRQDDERLEDKNRRIERLAEHRKTVQKKVDEENMRVRHRHMLHAANSLQTHAEPRLYYRPWDIRPDEEDRIADQLKDTRAQIDHELQLLKVEHLRPSVSAREPEESGSAVEGDVQADNESTTQPDMDTRSASGDEVNETEEAQAKSAEDAQSEPAGAANLDTHAENTDLTSPSPAVDTNVDSTAKSESDKPVPPATDVHTDDDGDHIVEGDEDTVIY